MVSSSAFTGGMDGTWRVGLTRCATSPPLGAPDALAAASRQKKAESSVAESTIAREPRSRQRSAARVEGGREGAEGGAAADEGTEDGQRTTGTSRIVVGQRCCVARAGAGPRIDRSAKHQRAWKSQYSIDKLYYIDLGTVPSINMCWSIRPPRAPAAASCVLLTGVLAFSSSRGSSNCRNLRLASIGRGPSE